MINRILKLTVSMCVVFYFFAYALANTPLQCSIIVNKDPTWANESVLVDIIDYATKQTIGTVSLPAATASEPSVNTATQVYDCKYQILQVQASYTPSVWSTDEGKFFSGKQIYNLTSYIVEAPGKNVIKIEFTVNFPGDFLDVPALVN